VTISTSPWRRVEIGLVSVLSGVSVAMDRLRI
jgi:hypothetical protein